MTALHTNHLEDAVQALRKDPVVIAMARGLHGVPREEITSPDGGPTSAFMNVANDEYNRRGGKYEGPKPVGAVGRAVLSLLASAGLTPQELYEDWDDAFLQKTIDRVTRRIDQTPTPPLLDLHAELVAEQTRRRNA
jgi:hypothetical protein